jgi:hypothetical protein
VTAVRPVTREELLDYQTYGDRRERIRAEVLRIKAPRRIQVGPHLTLLFENRDTVRYQIQEMMRTERIVREDAIRHELDTYNDLLGGPGELGATLLVELEDPAGRAARLAEWRELPGHIYVRLADRSQAFARFDPRQVGEDKLSAVQFLKFACRGMTPTAVGTDFPHLAVETDLTDAQRHALAEDLAD